MSSASSVVTYTSVYTDSEPWRFQLVSDVEPEAPEEAPPSLDYVPGPEHPPSLDYVLGPEHPLLPVYPLLDDASPTTLSPGYIADSDPEEDPVEDPADYLADGGDDDDDESSDDDDEEEEEEEDEEDDDEEEEHSAPTDSSVVPTVDLVPSAEDTEAFKTDEPAPTPPTSLHYGIRLRAASPPLLLPSTSHRIDIPKAEMPSRKRACFTTPASRLKVEESSAAAAARQPGPTLEADLRYRQFHRHTAMLLDREAMYARRAWTGYEDRSAAIEAHVRTLQAQVATLMAYTSSLQTQLTTSFDRIQTLEARDPEP
ncbi:hypothetical protein Tco_0252063 [Tanacetum coccineum]